MFAAGGMMWTSLVPVTAKYFGGEYGQGALSKEDALRLPPIAHVSGVRFPVVIHRLRTRGFPYIISELTDDIQFIHGEPVSLGSVSEEYVRINAVLLNVLIEIGVLIIVWFLCERWIRWRSRKRNL